MNLILLRHGESGNFKIVLLVERCWFFNQKAEKAEFAASQLKSIKFRAYYLLIKKLLKQLHIVKTISKNDVNMNGIKRRHWCFKFK